MTLKQFVEQSLAYIDNGKLSMREYIETIQYLLWRLAVTIHWLHVDMKYNDLDICPENIMLSIPEFILQSDGSVGINIKIEMKYIDVGMRELSNCDAMDNKCKLECNKEYFLQLKK
eukprot:124801_1